jgi:hypothetical protein
MNRVSTARHLWLPVATLATSLCARRDTRAQGWPPIERTRVAVSFSDARRADTTFVIKGAGGRPLYRLACHTSDYSGDSDFDYSGDFECRLTSLYSTESYSTLLTDNPDQSRDWQSRGRFLAEELIGKCGAYPEYGLVRHFRFRGMRITLALSGPVFDTVMAVTRVKRLGLQSFRLNFAADPDSGATSPIAEPPAYAEPQYAHSRNPNDLSKECDVVRKRED